MMQNNMQEQPQRNQWLQSKRITLILIGVIAVGAFFLLTGRTASLLAAWPFLFLLLCPFMMLFMHHGHGGHGGHDGADPKK